MGLEKKIKLSRVSSSLKIGPQEYRIKNPYMAGLFLFMDDTEKKVSEVKERKHP
jgi:hypothetical protein